MWIWVVYGCIKYTSCYRARRVILICVLYLLFCFTNVQPNEVNSAKNKNISTI
jgi:hypothetical protein